MHKAEPLKLGTRGSPLALVQARAVAAALVAAHGWPEDSVEIVPIKTTGDKVQDRPLAEIGGKALWTKELDRALLARDIDFAVHSAKDMESIRPDAIALAAALPRADVRERIIGVSGLDALRPGMRVGTTSPRRAAQLLARVPGLGLVPFRGNVATRLARIDAGEADATLLASAGLARLGMHDVGAPIPVEAMLPAPGQAIIAIEARTGDDTVLGHLAAINDADAMTALVAERAFAAALGGSCHSPVAALAERDGADFHLRAEILSTDGQERIAAEARFSESDAATAAETLARTLLNRASPALRSLFVA
ncbi:hydroxymethylbilane synthase [Sphingosinicella microcystinivorans]|uniref:Porphobilinogen deaminase n=1 Tax=Sphingosinicella microcystinivorans TaxID=335406 RepID=A0AAD1G0J5_SPHMI|nr:hydroxymethylbilane synthase [Sphingosinicella microcystinivorans]RKS90819.1 hydroxymethylbilane synthase [Sphingosinicella microcystinivorans]BBE33734.1 porphobilinogen deaminase [Sphingosinicella microcystinivorans]